MFDQGLGRTRAAPKITSGLNRATINNAETRMRALRE
jgi:hypothetical protein